MIKEALSKAIYDKAKDNKNPTNPSGKQTGVVLTDFDIFELVDELASEIQELVEREVMGGDEKDIQAPDTSNPDPNIWQEYDIARVLMRMNELTK